MSGQRIPNVSTSPTSPSAPMNIAAVPCFAVGISSFTKLACRTPNSRPGADNLALPTRPDSARLRTACNGACMQTACVPAHEEGCVSVQACLCQSPSVGGERRDDGG